MNTIPNVRNPVIRNSADYKNRNGLLGKKILSQNVITEVYNVSEISNYVTCNINLVNNSGGVAEVKLWISSEKVPSEIDLLESKIVLEPDAVYIRSVLILNKLETIFAESNSGNVIIRIDGYDDRPN
jgi:hypothetical protein